MKFFERIKKSETLQGIWLHAVIMFSCSIGMIVFDAYTYPIISTFIISIYMTSAASAIFQVFFLFRIMRENKKFQKNNDIWKKYYMDQLDYVHKYHDEIIDICQDTKCSYDSDLLRQRIGDAMVKYIKSWQSRFNQHEDELGLKPIPEAATAGDETTR